MRSCHWIMTIDSNRPDRSGGEPSDSGLDSGPAVLSPQWPPRAAVEGAWVEFEVVTASGPAAAIRFRIRSDYVEVWSEQRCCGVYDRNMLRTWLIRRPSWPLVIGEVTFSVDRYVDCDGRVAISLPGVQAWTLSPDVDAKLRELV